MNIETLAKSFTGRLITDAADMEPFTTDWRKRWFGKALAVALPDTTEDVAKVVRWCAANNVPIVPQGGNTGMSGAATPSADGGVVVLSLTRMNRVREVDPQNNTMTVEAGCILQTHADDMPALLAVMRRNVIVKLLTPVLLASGPFISTHL